MREMNQPTKTLSELEAEVIAANAALVEAQKAESIASQERCNAINRANRAQAALDAALLALKKAAPRDTDWARAAR